MTRSGVLSRLVLVSALATTGCDEDRTALQVRMVVDPVLNTEAQLLSVVETVDLRLDASGGFDGLDRAGQRVGSLVAGDPDGDGTLELTLTRDVRGRGALPLFRLRPGNNGDRSLQIGARGQRGTEVAAVGGLSWVRFVPGQVIDLLLPFNLRAPYRPPRVLLTLPSNGQTSVSAALAQVYLEFSKMVVASSTQGAVRLLYQSTGGDQPVPGTWVMGEISVIDLGLQERRSTAIFQVQDGCRLSPGTYRVEVATAVRDAAGQALDQDATSAGPDGFSGRFSIPGSARAKACGGAAQCTDDRDCDSGFVCDPITLRCVFAVADCSSLSCPQGYVCRPAAGGEAAQCVQDCRPAGSCAGAQDYCDEKTGLCLPCTSQSSSPKCGAVSEEVTCEFANSQQTTEECYSSSGLGCKGVGQCVVKVSGEKGLKIDWQSSCGGSGTTVIDGISEQVKFDCSSTQQLQENVTCLFGNSQQTQECYASTGGGCNGIGKCVATVAGQKGEQITWTSSCSGGGATIIDGVDEQVSFSCR
jgi:hypothetical protein